MRKVLLFSFLCLLQLMSTAQQSDSVLYSNIYEKIRSDVFANYDTIISNQYHYEEFVFGADSLLKAAAIVNGACTGKNLYPANNSKKYQLPHGYYMSDGVYYGADSTRANSTLFQYSGTYLTQIQSGGLGTFFAKKELLKRGHQMSQSLMLLSYKKADTINTYRVKNLTDETGTFWLLFYKRTVCFYPLLKNSAECDTSITTTLYKVNKKNYAIEMFISKKEGKFKGLDLFEFEYQTFKPVGNKYYADSLYRLHPRAYKNAVYIPSGEEAKRGLIVRIHSMPEKEINLKHINGTNFINIDNIQRQLLAGEIKPFYFNDFCKNVPAPTEGVIDTANFQMAVLNKLAKEFEVYLEKE